MWRAIDDAEAVARSRGDDLDAYAVLVAPYALRAHRAAFLLGTGEEADDAVQEAFVKAFGHLSRFRAGEPFGPWLLRIATNATKNLTCSRRRRAALALRLSMTDRPARHSTALPARCWRRHGARLVAASAGMSAHARHGQSVPKVPILPPGPYPRRVRA